jgi:hypothetical protein
VARIASYRRSVFINCPFSPDYQRIFRAILFAIYACEFRPRCALEAIDSSQNRFTKIQQIIRESKFGIHDISNMELDPKTNLPRFNMPFELGLFFAAKAFGSNQQKNKIALILDSGDYRYRESLSDISGQDISSHGGDPEKAIHKVRDWLDTCRGGNTPLPGGSHIVHQYRSFNKQLRSTLKKMKLDLDEVTWPNLCRSMELWLKENS